MSIKTPLNQKGLVFGRILAGASFLALALLIGSPIKTEAYSQYFSPATSYGSPYYSDGYGSQYLSPESGNSSFMPTDAGSGGYGYADPYYQADPGYYGGGYGGSSYDSPYSYYPSYGGSSYDPYSSGSGFDCMSSCGGSQYYPYSGQSQYPSQYQPLDSMGGGQGQFTYSSNSNQNINTNTNTAVSRSTNTNTITNNPVNVFNPVNNNNAAITISTF